MKFSVIIPLEFHRDFAERCVRAWTQTQSVPRASFEILLAIPPHLSESQIARLASMLASHDRLLRLSGEHDISLITQAAHEAKGEVLVFTESHCEPEADFLEQCIKVLAEHTEWAGFSCRSIPITHNLLSEIEAAMYDADIQRNLQEHPWLKVLDQCLVMRREAYWAVGGVEPPFGHFAEWVFAARLYRQGFKMGYDRRPAVRHYYVGDLHELAAFTLDFAAGQIRFAQSAPADPCGDLFDEIPEWSQRQHWNRQVAGCMTRLLLRDRWQTLFGKPQLECSFWRRLMRWPWLLAGAWLLRRTFSLNRMISWLRCRQLGLRWVLQWHLRTGNKPRAHKAFLRLIALWVHLGRLQYLSGLGENAFEDECTKPTLLSEWQAGIRQSLPSAGLHMSELADRKAFRWSEPAAMIWLPPLQGEWCITIEWGNVVPFGLRQRARFSVNECHIPPECIAHRDDVTELKVLGDGTQPLRLAWVSETLTGTKDPRRLGLPLCRVAWVEST